MKSFLLFLIFLALGFFGGFGIARSKALHLRFSTTSDSQMKERSTSFQPTPYPSEALPFCIVIVGKNSGVFLEKTLQSALSQNYENFRIVYIDDASEDGSFALASRLVHNHPSFSKVHLLQNKTSIGTLASLSAFVKRCSQKEILVILNDADYLSHEWVLQRLNQYYADPDLWLTYGRSLDYPTFQPTSLWPLEASGGGIRASLISSSQLKTFYAGLFGKIKESDFQSQGEFFGGNGDFAYMIPMLEMAQGHFQCLPDVLSIVNRDAMRREKEENLSFFEKEVRSFLSYEKLESLDLYDNQGGE